MKTIKLKHTLASGGNLMPQHPQAKLGYHNGCMTIAVTGLSDDATTQDAKRIAESCMMPPWLHTVDAAQAGKNLHRPENLTKSQLATAPDWFREKYGQPAYRI
jgi:hypothetical protein